MDINEFWEIIELGKDSEEPEDNLRINLEKLTPEEIVSFKIHFDYFFDRAYTWNLWGAAYIIGGGCSDDGFIDFRYGLISQGRVVYSNAIENPESLAELGEDLEIENELYGYVADEVYEEKTGKEISISAVADNEDSMGEEWDFDDEEENIKRFPKLMALYW
ncbi:DUF4240 domain-containing protein [Rheinheimera sp. WS51]|uniref:DUF4240 domain-containing protein n=1 Tax=Rheinheimera sp. WS51 TaxID=3425886 RepID=UPI003D940F11